MTEYCPKCGGELELKIMGEEAYRGTKVYVCKSCGINLTRDELSKLRDELSEIIRSELNNSDDKINKKRRQGEYLEWWLSKKT